MPSLSDIPQILLSPTAQEDFIAWLNKQPIDAPTKRRFARLWRDALSVKWSAADYYKLNIDDDA